MITRGQALARKAPDSHHEFLRQTFGAALALRKRRWSMVAHDLAAGSCGLTWR
jgi:hypothetical protein